MVHYCLKVSAFPTAYACHCLFCQTWTGSAFSLQVVAVEEALKVSGAPYLYERVSDGGERVTRQRALHHARLQHQLVTARHGGAAGGDAGSQ